MKSGNFDISNDLNNDIVEYEFLTDKQQSYLNKYKDILSTLKDDIKPVIEKLHKLDKEILSNCLSEEAVSLLICTSVGRHSLQYWHDNLYKWAALFKEDVEPIVLVPRLKGGTVEVNANKEDWEWFKSALVSMGQSDGIGAAIGAGLGSLAGGVGAIPGAITVGCNASAGAGIKELLKRWGVF